MYLAQVASLQNFVASPVILHEQNAVAGLTNEWLAKNCDTCITSFSNCIQRCRSGRKPSSPRFIEMPSPQARFSERSGKLRVLVVGGSQGARVLNQTIPQVVARLADKLEVRHQVGKGSVESVTALYGEHADSVKITEFIDDMAEAYAWADVVICRSGALTVCELAAVGAPAIFVPFQHKDQQQYLNAKYLADVGAAKIVQQNELNADVLVDFLEKTDRETLLAMAIKAKEMSAPLAAKRVADVIVENAK